MRLFSNRSQMTSKCHKNKEVAHKQQSCVSLMFSPHFDVLCDLLLNRPTAIWNLFCFIQWRRKEKRPIHIPALYFLAVRGFLLVWHSLTPYLSSLLLLFLLSYTCIQFLVRSRMMAKSFCKILSLSKRWHTMATDVKISCSLDILKLSRTLFAFISPFFLCK